MKNQWKLLLLRSYRSSSSSSSHRPLLSHSPRFQVLPSFTRPFSSLFLHERSGFGALQQSQSLFALRRSFTSDLAIVEKRSDEVAVIDAFSRLSSKDEIKKEMDSNDIVMSHDLVLNVLRTLESSPEIAGRFFSWVLEVSPKRVSSKSYNTMLRILGGNGLVEEFWNLVDDMKKKGHGVSGNVRDKVGEKF